ncbi:MAG TPA: prepilin-type N-terminal cleavage/methylation domain-containing protein [Candidatus Limnocylindrales bacterium]|nr:prepilin-type N-terminal cleavage/methylation domain-containing protein [Candidatus Limnocylindrales bacterium]
MRRRSERGFTLVELILALSIVGALLAVIFGGLRVGLASWRQGEDRAEAQQHTRSLVQVLGRTFAGIYPYRAVVTEGGRPNLLFKGEEDRLVFVTAAPLLPPPIPAAFTAVTLSVEDDDGGRALVVRQKVLPNDDPFELVKPAFADPTVASMRLRYLREGAGWESAWDASGDGVLPRAIEISITTRVGERLVEHPPLTVSIRVSP